MKRFTQPSHPPQREREAKPLSLPSMDREVKKLTTPKSIADFNRRLEAFDLSHQSYYGRKMDPGLALGLTMSSIPIETSHDIWPSNIPESIKPWKEWLTAPAKGLAYATLNVKHHYGAELRAMGEIGEKLGLDKYEWSDKEKNWIEKDPSKSSKLTEYGKEIIKENKEYLENLPGKPKGDDKLESFLFNLGSGAASLGAAVGLHALTGGSTTPVLLFGWLAGTGKYQEAREADVSVGKAAALGGAAAVTEGALEAIGLEFLMARYPSKALGFVIRSSSEALQEGLQEFGSNVWSKIGIDKQQRLSENVGQAALMGAILAGGASSAFSLVGYDKTNGELKEAGLTDEESGFIIKNIIPKLEMNIGEQLKENLDKIKTDPKEVAKLHSIKDMLEFGKLTEPIVLGLMGERVETAGLKDAPRTPEGISKELQPLAIEARKYKSAEEFVNIKRPPVIKEIVGAGGNPLYHDTSLTGLKGILESGEIKLSKVMFQKKPVVSVTRDFDNFSRYADSPYRLILDEKAIGHKGTPYSLIPGERLGGEAETVFSRPVSGKSIKAIGLNTSHPQVASDLISGKLDEIVNLAKSKGIKIEFFDGKKMITAEQAQLTAKSQLTDFYNQATKTEVVEKIKEPMTGEKFAIMSEGAYQSKSIDQFVNSLPQYQKPVAEQVKDESFYRIKKGIGEGYYPQTYKTKKEAQNVAKDLIIQETRDAGIAFRVTKGGKIVPAIRPKSGFAVSEEFAMYDNFKDLKLSHQNTLDPTRAALTADQVKIEEGYRGPIYKNILEPARHTKMARDFTEEDYVGKRIKLKKKYGLKGKKDSIKAGEVLERISGADVNKDTALLAKKLKAEEKYVGFAQETRKVLDGLRELVNTERVAMGKKAMDYIENYMPHMQESNTWNQLFGLKVKPHEIVKDKYIPDYIKPNAPFNPHAEARKNKLRTYEKDFDKVYDSYVHTMMSDIYNTPIVQNTKAHVEVLKTKGLDNTAAYFENWAVESYGGLSSTWDRTFKITHKQKKAIDSARRILHRAVFPFNFAWNLTIQTSSSGLTMARYQQHILSPTAIKWFVSKGWRNEVHKNYYSLFTKSRKQGRLMYQDLEIPLKLDRRTPLETMETVGTYLGDVIEYHLTGWSASAAYSQGQKRGLKGKDLRAFASDGGAFTQSMYNKEDLPGLLRSSVIKAGAPWQTFSFELYNTVKEVKGAVGSPRTVNERVKIGLTLIAVAMVMNAGIERLTGRRPWKIASAIPIAGQWFQERNPIVLASLITDTWTGFKELIETGDSKKLRRQLITYGTSAAKIPGGVQFYRIYGAIEEQMKGGVFSEAGKSLYRVDRAPVETAKSFLLGPAKTKAGRAYFDEKVPFETKDYPSLEKELSRLKTTLGFPSTSVFGLGLNSKEYEWLKEKTGKEIAKTAASVINTSEYKILGDEEKKKLIERTINDVKDRYKVEVLEQSEEGRKLLKSEEVQAKIKRTLKGRFIKGEEESLAKLKESDIYFEPGDVSAQETQRKEAEKMIKMSDKELKTYLLEKEQGRYFGALSEEEVPFYTRKSYSEFLSGISAGKEIISNQREYDEKLEEIREAVDRNYSDPWYRAYRKQMRFVYRQKTEKFLDEIVEGSEGKAKQGWIDFADEYSQRNEAFLKYDTTPGADMGEQIVDVFKSEVLKMQLKNRDFAVELNRYPSQLWGE